MSIITQNSSLKDFRKTRESISEKGLTKKENEATN